MDIGLRSFEKSTHIRTFFFGFPQDKYELDFYHLILSDQYGIGINHFIDWSFPSSTGDTSM